MSTLRMAASTAATLYDGNEDDEHEAALGLTHAKDEIHTHMNEVVLIQLENDFEALDSNKDGVVDREEWVNQEVRGPSHQTLQKILSMESLEEEHTNRHLKDYSSLWQAAEIESYDAMFHRSTGVQKFIDNEPDDEDHIVWYRWYIGCQMESFPVQVLSVVLVMVAGVFMALSVDGTISNETALWIEIPLLVVFNFEILTRAFCLGPYVYFADWYNCFDFASVFGSDLAQLQHIFSSDEGESSASVFMMIRMVRVFRLLRLVTRLKPLEVIVDAFVSGMKDVAWILVLCMLILFISGIIVTNWFLGNSALPPDTQERYFRSVGMSMVTLLRVMTMDWWDVITDTGDHVPVSYAFFFAFLVLAGFGIMGLFAAVFVESLLNAKVHEERLAESNVQRAKTALQKDILALLAAADEDGSRTLSETELQGALDVFENQPVGCDPVLWERWRDGLIAKRDIMGLSAGSFRSAFTLATTAVVATGKDIVYDDIVESVFQMDDPATKRDSVMLLQHMLDARKQVDDTNAQKMEAWMQVLQKSQQNLESKVDRMDAKLDLILSGKSGQVAV